MSILELFWRQASFAVAADAVGHLALTSTLLNSCVGVMQNGKVEILVNDQGNRITPSYVAFTDEERLVGDAAKNQYAANPERTIFDIKYVVFSGKEYDCGTAS